MKRLVFDTSTKTVLIGLMEDEKWVKTWDFPDESYQQSKIILSLIQSCLDEADWLIKDVDELALGLGPGSYTGVRVGLTIAKTWCYARKVPLYSFDSKKLVSGDEKLQLGHLQTGDFKSETNIMNLSPTYEGDHFAE